MSGFRFELAASDGLARAGLLHTDHGAVETPVFMPVGTQATVKGMTVRALRESGSSMILGNTYHLYLRPGHERIASLGGLHVFSGFDGPMLTDSGGFQVFSLAKLRRMDEDGVEFQSHLDGSSHRFTPELSMDIQAALGADVVMAFDHCPELPATIAEIQAAVDRTLRWTRRCLDRFGPRRMHPVGHEQVLFGIVQGGLEAEERERCAAELRALDLPGYAIGGLSVGESKQDMHRVSALTAAFLPEEKPRYLMGVGFPEDILAAVAGGVDMFDCVLPTRMARTACLLGEDGRLVMRNARFADDDRPVQADCDCYTCQHHSRAYLRHLFMANEVLAVVLGTMHNLRFYQRLMADIRRSIRERRFAAFRESFERRFLAGDGRAD